MNTPTTSYPLIVRVDADGKIGTGHFMRCLSLAQGWKETGGKVLFVTSCHNENLHHRLVDERFEVVRLTRTYPDPADTEMTTRVLSQYSGSWVALDGYHFDFSYQEMIQRSGCRLLLFDDNADQPYYPADAILNQNIHAKNLHYPCKSGTQLLLGTDYVLLRKEFLTWGRSQRKISEVARRILVTMGGSDPDNQTLKTIQALGRVPIEGLEVIVVVGDTNPHSQALQSAVNDLPLPVRLIKNPTNMPELMAWADLAVSAGGSTCWELAFMGLPSLLLILAKNQQTAVGLLDDLHIFENAGWFREIDETSLVQKIVRLACDEPRRKSMSQAGQMQVDGLGKSRVIESLNGESHRAPV